MDAQLTNRYAANLHEVLSCYDHILIVGTMPGACYAGGMTNFLYSRGIRIFDYAKVAATVNQLKGSVTMLFIAHQSPRTLKVNQIVRIDADDGAANAGGVGVKQSDGASVFR